MVIDDGNEPSLKRKLLVGGLLAAVGAVVGASAARAALTANLPWEDAAAVILSAALIGMAVISGVVMAVRPATVPKGCGTLQVAVLLAAGLMFLAPVFATRWAGPQVVFAGIALVLIGQTVANLMLWRQADEMLRRIMSETAVLTFWIVQTALFLYAAAERLGLINGLSAWGMISILMAVYLFSSCVAAARRGIH